MGFWHVEAAISALQAVVINEPTESAVPRSQKPGHINDMTSLKDLAWRLSQFGSSQRNHNRKDSEQSCHLAALAVSGLSSYLSNLLSCQTPIAAPFRGHCLGRRQLNATRRYRD